jgi:TolA-binding protein
MKSVWTRGGSLAFAVCLGAAGCVYYNTFYNAQKRYREADQKRLEAESRRTDRRSKNEYRRLYMNAIEKASVVLDRHPKSKWVDDSLLLIGKSFYWREDYQEALLKFGELRDNFPKSSLLAEARYYRGLTLQAMGKTEDARNILADIGSDRDASFGSLAKLALAELEVEQGNYEAAIMAYERLLSESKKGDRLRAQVWKGIGDALWELKRYPEAEVAFRNVLTSKPETGVDYYARLRIGELMELQGDLDGAMAHYAGVRKMKRLGNYEPDIRLKQANVHTLKGDLKTAIQDYEEIVEDFPRSAHSAEAYYQMGVIEQKQRKDLEKAQELFEVARKERANSDAGIRAQERYKDLTMLKRHQRTAGKGGKKSLPAMVDVAELYLFKLGEPDSALATYDRILEKADTTEYAPKALYAKGVIYADSLGDADAATGAFKKLIDTFPVSAYAVEARKRMQGGDEDDARSQFLQAEALRDDGAGSERYVTVLKELAVTHPNSMYAPKALYNVAWAYENQRGNLDTARVYYELLVQRYPLTEFAEVAKDKLKGGYLKPAPPEPVAPKEKKAKADGEGTASGKGRATKVTKSTALRSPIDTSRVSRTSPKPGRADTVTAEVSVPLVDSTQAGIAEVAEVAAPPHQEGTDSTVAQAATPGPDPAATDTAGSVKGTSIAGERDSTQAAKPDSVTSEAVQPTPDSTKAGTPASGRDRGEEGGGDAAER